MDKESSRYTEKPFPAYAYLPGGEYPHPVNHPDGHLFGQEEGTDEILESTNFMEVESYLYGVDLFNHGFYWEAHEAWEGLWQNLDRQSKIALFLQGLIQLAASYLKVKTKNQAGFERLNQSAKEKLYGVFDEEGDLFLGLRREDVARALALEVYISPNFPTFQLNPG